LLFEVPEIIGQIPDIKAIYDINETQSENLETVIERMDKNIFLEQMDEETTARWETMLGINPQDNDTLDDRRFRIKASVLERRPYTETAIRRKLQTLCPEGYEMSVDTDRQQVTIKIALKSRKMIQDVRKYIEDILPLNMVYTVMVMWNQYSTFTGLTYAEMQKRTHKQLREESVQ
jgi:hypothetical protein